MTLASTGQVEERTLFASSSELAPFAAGAPEDPTSVEWIEELVRSLLTEHRLPPPVLQRRYRGLLARWSFVDWEVSLLAELNCSTLSALRHADGAAETEVINETAPRAAAARISAFVQRFRWT